MSAFGILIGVAIGCVIAMVIIAVVLLCRMRARRRRERELRVFLGTIFDNPRFCKWLVDNGDQFAPALEWPLIRSLMKAHTGVDPGEAPDWDSMLEDYDTEHGYENEMPPQSKMSSRRGPVAINTVRAMLEEFDDWKRETDTPTDDGVSVSYRVRFIYIGPDLIRRKITRDELLTSGNEPPPGRYEVHIVDSNGKDLVEPFTAEQPDFGECGDYFGSAMSAALGDLETQIRNQRARVDAAEKREERYKTERDAALDQVSALIRERATLQLRLQKAEEAMSNTTGMPAQ